MVASPKKPNKANKKRGLASAVATGHAEPKAHESQKTHESPVPIDRRAASDRRGASERRRQNAPVAVERRALERRTKVTRRRQIDPTTCERDYTNDEIEFMNALDDYKRTSGRMFPTCSEVLEVVKKLGYQKATETPPALPCTGQSGVDVLPAVVVEAVVNTAVLVGH